MIPFLLVTFRPVYAIIYNHLFSYFILYNLLTFVGCSVLLCIPVICMGATLPILCRFYVSRLSHLGARAGRLYGLNTIGAAFGALLCGFWLINLLGVRGTLIFAVAINGIIGVVCILAGTAAQRQQQAKEPTDTNLIQPGPDDGEQTDESVRYPVEVIGALVLFGVSGFCAMSYEVIWTKLLGLIVGPTTYSFTIVLVTFISGLALGSIVFGWLGDRSGKAVKLLVLTQTGAALSALGVSQLLGNSQLFFAKVIFKFQDNFALLSIAKVAILFGFMILPTFCLGATFPLVGKIYTRSVSRVARSIGSAYAINTIGAVLGSFCAGFVLVPLFGKENGLRFVISLQLLVSLVVTFIVFRREKILKLVPFVLPALAGLLLCSGFPVWNRRALSIGTYHRFNERGLNVKEYGWAESLFSGSRILAESQSGEPVFYGDGIGGFTTVLKYSGPLGNVEYSMVISGKPDASSRGDMKTQTLAAHLPMLFHAGAKKVMVLGLASGITAGEVLYYPVEQLDVIDINREVVAASEFFRPWNNNVLSNPKTNLIIQDARAHLQLTRQKYDVIISEPSNPWMAGLATLFTRDFFELARNRLGSSGIFVQFLHLYEMDWPTFALVGRAFADVFENNILVSSEPAGFGADCLFVGFNGPGGLDIDNAERNISYTQKSKNVTLLRPELLHRLIIGEDIRRLFGDGPVNTDNRPRLEFAAPKTMYQSDPMIPGNIRSNEWFSPETADIIGWVRTNIDLQIDFAAYALSVYAPFENMVDMSKANQAQKERFFQLVETYCAGEMMNFALLDDKELVRRCRSIQINAIKNKISSMPDKVRSYFYLGDLYYATDMPDEAIAAYSKSLLIKPGDPQTNLNLGIAFNKSKKYDKAIAHFTEAMRISPSFASIAHKHTGYALFLAGRFMESAEQYQMYLEAYPDDAYIHNDLGVALARSGDLGRAINHFRQAVRIKPDLAVAKKHLENALILQKRLNSDSGRPTEAEQSNPNVN
jgi:spermidine synthase